MNIIFRDKFLDCNEVFKFRLIDVNDVLIKNGVMINLGDNHTNDWAGYSYYFCKNKKDLDEYAIHSFIYIVTWFMAGNPVVLEGSKYFKNDKIVNECLKIYNELVSNFDSEVEICRNLFNMIYNFYVVNYKDYVKRSERINCVLTYHELDLFENVEGKNRTEKLQNLLSSYYERS